MLSDLPVITLSSPGVIAFNLGNWQVRWYGIFIALGFLATYFFAEKLVIKHKLSTDHFCNLIFLVLIFSIVFARLWFVFLSWEYFKDHSDEIPKIWHGGQSIHGGILGVVLGTILYSKLKNISFYNYMDIISVVAPLGQCIGRWGNFFNNEAFGLPVGAGLPCPYLRLYIPQEFRPDEYLTSDYFHPTFLYESALNFMLFLFLFKKFSLWRKTPGKTFWSYLLGYSIIRFFLEFLRTDSLYLIGNIPSAHVVSVVLFIISLIFLCKNNEKI